MIDTNSTCYDKREPAERSMDIYPKDNEESYTLTCGDLCNYYTH